MNKITVGKKCLVLKWITVGKNNQRKNQYSVATFKFQDFPGLRAPFHRTSDIDDNFQDRRLQRIGIAESSESFPIKEMMTVTRIGSNSMMGLWKDRIFLATRIQKIRETRSSTTTSRIYDFEGSE
ncbi:hypothetical protein B9Z55_014316 [Caenorhabditis nigoni]|uniref:Uncharacterized protein n=1 Tax=Caenorhabditis nigoni TaxID=1611254 RepID=A0A2G5U5E8_9PELO|nr:hypothetical protein B9Z55_014316 [Caenorhabditis nigoni]